MKRAINENAKFYVGVGGFAGFTITFLSGLVAKGDYTVILRDAAIGCVVGAIITKCFLHIIYSNLQVALEKKAKEAAESDDNKEVTQEASPPGQ